MQPQQEWEAGHWLGDCVGEEREPKVELWEVQLAKREWTLDPGARGILKASTLTCHRHRFPQTWCFFPSTLPPRSKPGVLACHPQMPRRALPCSPLCLRHQSLAISIPFLPKHKAALDAQALVRQTEGDDRTMPWKHKSSAAKCPGNVILGVEFHSGILCQWDYVGGKNYMLFRKTLVSKALYKFQEFLRTSTGKLF